MKKLFFVIFLIWFGCKKEEPIKIEKSDIVHLDFYAKVSGDSDIVRYTPASNGKNGSGKDIANKLWQWSGDYNIGTKVVLSVTASDTIINNNMTLEIWAMDSPNHATKVSSQTKSGNKLTASVEYLVE